jgi:hypothetical protein
MADRYPLHLSLARPASLEKSLGFQRSIHPREPPPVRQVVSVLYQFIFIFASISAWKSGTWRSSPPMKG